MARLLLIEDDQEISTLLDRYLRRHGHTCVAVGDGDTGIKTFISGNFDVVLTDGLLPKKSGYQVIEGIRATPEGKRVGIIMMSAAFKGLQARKEAIDKGVDAFFAKPFILTELKEKIHELLKQYGRDTTPTPPVKGALPRTRTKPPVKPTSTPPSPPVAAPSQPVAAPKPPPQAVPSPTPAAPQRTPEPGRNEEPSGSRPRPRPTEAVRRAAPDKVGTVENVQNAGDTAQLLLRCARQRFTGIARFVDEQNQLLLAFIGGVVVGANDNLREHLLGERLWKQGRLTTEQMRELNLRMNTKGERVAEALLALGLCTADEAFQFVEEQAVARARRSLGWTGAVQFKESDEEAENLATTALDVFELVVGWAFDPAQEPDAGRFVASNALTLIERHPKLEELLAGFARVRPTARLPGALLSGAARTVVEAASASSASEVFAGWLCGLFALPTDVAFDVRPLPDLLRGDLSTVAVDKDAAQQVCEVLLRARGRDLYELVGEDRTATRAVMAEKIQALADKVGRGALGDKALGPATVAARELWELLDEAGQVFSDDLLRDAYDQGLAPVRKPVVRQAGPEDLFLQGQQAMAAGSLEYAVRCFEEALAGRPADPDYACYLGWGQVLLGQREVGVGRLVAAMKAHPQALRPVFFLGLLAAKEGNKERARALLEECAKRSPGDVEVKAALQWLN